MFSFMKSYVVLYVCLASLHTVMVVSSDDNDKERMRQRKPNIVLFMSDDQDIMLGSMDVMERTRERVIDKGASFNNAFATSPICCPSRSSFLTGLYSHNHHVLTNNDNCSSLAWQRKYETRTFATYLNESGYATGYFGKYLNEYRGNHVPPGWQYWMGLVKNTRYYNYTLRHNDRKEHHRDSYQDDYLTDLVVNRSMDYFRKAKQDNPEQPILTFLSFPAPHGPEAGAPQYQHLYGNVSSHITPSYNYVPNPDKHWIMQLAKDPMEETQHRFSVMLQQKRLQSLRSVDDAVEKFVAMLDEMGELDNTYVLYTSDHGFHIGQFGLAKGKSMPYDFDIRVPLYLRGPDIPAGLQMNEIVLNIDIAPTILGLAGIDAPPGMDGRNFLPLLRRQDTGGPPWRDSFLVERGKIPFSRVHLARPSLPSKQEKINQACQRPKFAHPCVAGQAWTCVMEEPGLRMRKCNKFRTPRRPKSRRPRPSKAKRCCVRNPPDADTIVSISRKCKRRLSILSQRGDFASLTKRRRRLRRAFGYDRASILRDVVDGGLAASPDDSFQWLERSKRRARFNPSPGTTNSNRSSNIRKVVLGPRCYMLLPGYEFRCGPAPSVGKRVRKKKFGRHMKIALDVMNFRIKYMRVLRRCISTGMPRRTTRKKKCKCSASYDKPNASGRSPANTTANENPLKSIAQEIRAAHQQRLAEFRAAREERRHSLLERQTKQERRERAKNSNSSRRCSSAGVTCFKLNTQRWVTPPRWEGEEECYCTNANNNTYWCVRVINSTHNLLYCEFITGFIEFYDLNKDPHQLQNTYYEQSSDVHNALNSELAYLRRCKGMLDCHVWRNTSGQQEAQANATSPPAATTADKTTNESPVDPLLDSATAITTRSSAYPLPTNYPPGTNYREQDRSAPAFRRFTRPRRPPQQVDVEPRPRERSRPKDRLPGCNDITRRRNFNLFKTLCRAERLRKKTLQRRMRKSVAQSKRSNRFKWGGRVGRY